VEAALLSMAYFPLGTDAVLRFWPLRRFLTDRLSGIWIFEVYWRLSTPECGAVFTWMPSAPFTVTPGDNQTLTVTYTPVEAGMATDCLSIVNNNPDKIPDELQLSGTAIEQPQTVNLVDLDIHKFKVTKKA
jgi:hypothetical protein